MTVQAVQFLPVARALASRDAGLPMQPSLARAVSTAYYALRRVLLHEVVDVVLGWRFGSTFCSETVRPLYRTVDHGYAKAVFSRVLNERSSSADLKWLARTFVDLQAERIRADYDPHPDLRRSEAVELIDQAAAGIALLKALAVDVKRPVCCATHRETALTDPQ